MSEQQRETAAQLRIPKEEYARSALAGERAAERLLAKTKRFAKLLQETLKMKAANAGVESVGLKIWEDAFDISIEIDGVTVPVRVAEDLVDDLFERGSSEAEQRISKILDLALQTRVS